jgi:phage baseplate assembly protein W
MANGDSIYSDLDMKWRKLTSGDVYKVFDETAINQALLSLFSTFKGERYFNPTYGSRIPFLLFEPFDSLTAQLIVEDIQESVRVWEPRVEITDLDIDMDFDKQVYNVTMVYRIKSTTETGLFETILKTK